MTTTAAGKQGPPGANGAGKEPSRKDQAYAAIKEKILTNVFAAGEFIDDVLEAQQLGMSKTPVREALLLLEAEGLVEVLPRRGIRVSPISLEDMREIYQVLSALEIAAVELIAERKPGKDMLEPLSRACADMRRALAAADSLAWNDADEAFHRGLLRLSGNRHLAETGIRYRERVQRGHLIAMRLTSDENLELSIARHEETVALLLSDDPRKAVEAHQQQRITAGLRAINTIRDSGLKVL
ncbi:GntR family transcriptional regulator [Mameliella alba]|nr:GntR family transcriptional regulator [Mameliella alba]MCA0956431.1 GntR family transcriptional regulator [Mameliella alba]